MNNQEFESRMNFLMDQHTQFEQRHRVWKVEIEDILARLARVTKEGFKDHGAKMNALIDAQIRTEEQQRKTDEQLHLLTEAQRRTEQTLDRYLRSKFNGGNNN
jgi:hypothetical protein